MNPTIQRSVKINVLPELDDKGLCSKISYRDAGVPSLKRRGTRDPYQLKVDFVSPGSFVEFEHALSAVETFGKRRLLTLHELLCLNREDLAIFYRYPVFIEEYVLEYKVEDTVGVEGEDSRRDWAIRLSAYHRGQVLDSDSVFATTELTAVELGEFTEEYLEKLVSAPVSVAIAPKK